MNRTALFSLHSHKETTPYKEWALSYSSFILHPSSFILHPSSVVLHPSFFSSCVHERVGQGVDDIAGDQADLAVLVAGDVAG
jgi:hypothetical protein